MRAALVLALLLGCSGKKEPAKPEAPKGPVVSLGRISLLDATPRDKRPVAYSADALKMRLVKAFEAKGVKPKPVKGAWVLGLEVQVRYGVGSDEGIAAKVVAGEALVLWGAQLKLRPPGDQTALKMFLGSRQKAQFPGGDAAALRALLDTHMGLAAEDLVGQVMARVGVMGRDVPGLIEALGDAAPATRHAAAARLGMLRDKAGVKPLAKAVRVEKEREVQLRMVGAIAEIGEAGADEALIELVNPRDRELLRAVLDALAVVGGERVADFFDILESHDAEDVRAMVKEARTMMKLRKAQ